MKREQLASNEAKLFLGELLEEHPGLLQIAADLSDSELREALFEVANQIDLGLPVLPPPQFVSQVSHLLADSTQDQSESLLEVLGIEAANLNLQELELLTAGILWGTMLLSLHSERAASDKRVM